MCGVEHQMCNTPLGQQGQGILLRRDGCNIRLGQQGGIVLLQQGCNHQEVGGGVRSRLRIIPMSMKYN